MKPFTVVVIALFAAAAGAAAALYFYCPTLCKQAVHGGVAGFLHDTFGLSSGTSDKIAGLFV